MSAVAKTSSTPIHLHEKIGEVAHQAYYQSASAASKVGKLIKNVAQNIDQGIWKDRTVAKLDRLDEALEKKMPNFAFQKKLDHIGQYIQKKFAPLNKFNTWLNSNGHGAWDLKLATFLVKLPLRVARNIINLLYQIIKAIISFAVHPLKSINTLAKMILSLAHQLTKPETWTLIGTGVIGGGLGQMAVTGNLFALLGVAIGGAMVVGGLSLGALKAAIKAEKGRKWNAAYQNIKSQFIQIPEELLTGLCMGAMMAGIQQAINKNAAINKSKKINKNYLVSSESEKRKFVDEFIKKNGLPKESHSFYYEETRSWYERGQYYQAEKGKMGIFWIDRDQTFYKKFPEWFDGKTIPKTTYVDMYFSPDGRTGIHLSSVRNGNSWDGWHRTGTLKEFGLKGAFYPESPLAKSIVPKAVDPGAGFAVGGANSLFNAKDKV